MDNIWSFLSMQQKKIYVLTALCTFHNSLCIKCFIGSRHRQGVRMKWYIGKIFFRSTYSCIKSPQYDKLRTSCVHKLFWMSKQKRICVHNMFSTCSELGIFMYWTHNLLSYCGLVDTRISASEKGLPVSCIYVSFCKRVFTFE